MRTSREGGGPRGQRRKIEWQVTRPGNPEPEAAPTPAVTAPVQTAVLVEAITSTRSTEGKVTTPPAPPAPAKPNGQAGPGPGGPPEVELLDPMKFAAATMTSALCAALDAVQATELHGLQKGYPVRFTSEDIRAVALTLYINFAKGGPR